MFEEIMKHEAHIVIYLKIMFSSKTRVSRGHTKKLAAIATILYYTSH